MTTTFTIADVAITLETPRPIKITEGFRPFLGGSVQRRATVRVWETDRLPDLSGDPVFCNPIFAVFPDGAGGYLRRYHDHKAHDRPYAVTRLCPGENRVEVACLAGDAAFFSESQNCFSHIALEALLLREKRAVLHAACVETPLGGLLFSGPSGIGKSTQAALWEQYAGARLINGDRTIVRPSPAGWLGHGSPYAGSSHCFVNRSTPVRAVVLLRQGSACRVERLPLPAAFRALYANATVNSWNSAYVARISALLSDMAAQTPVYRLTCTPDRAAVDTLMQELEVAAD